MAYRTWIKYTATQKADDLKNTIDSSITDIFRLSEHV